MATNVYDSPRWRVRSFMNGGAYILTRKAIATAPAASVLFMDSDAWNFAQQALHALEPEARFADYADILTPDA